MEQTTMGVESSHCLRRHCLGLLFGLVLLNVHGCALKPVVPYDNTEKMLLGLAVSGQAIDYYSTTDALSRGCVEANPLFGEHPDEEILILSKLTVSLMAYLVANDITDHDVRKWFLGAVSSVGIGAGAWNLSQECDQQ